MSAKINGKFYPLQHEEWLRACRELKPAERDVLYYLRTLDPFGEKEIDIGVTEIAIALNRNKGTVSRALKVLDRDGWIDLELIQVKVRLTSKSQSLSPGNEVVSTQQSCPDATPVVSTQPQLSPHNSSCPDATPVVSTQQPQPQTQTEKDFQNPKTNKTYSDFIQTLSEDERERFLKFARSKADRLPETPQLIEKWIVDNHHWLYLEFEKINGQEPKHSGPGQGSAPPIDDEKSDLHPLVEAGLADGRIDRLDPKFDGLFDAQNNWWKVDAWIENAATRGDDADAPNDCDKYRSQVREWLAQSLVNNPDDKTEPVSLTPIPQPQEVS